MRSRTLFASHIVKLLRIGALSCCDRSRNPEKIEKSQAASCASNADHADRGFDCFAFHAQRDTQMFGVNPFAAACKRKTYNDDGSQFHSRHGLRNVRGLGVVAAAI